MNLEKEKPVNEEVAELKELIKELHGSVHQLQSEVATTKARKTNC